MIDNGWREGMKEKTVTKETGKETTTPETEQEVKKEIHINEFLITSVDGYKKPAYYFDKVFFEAFKCHNEFVHVANKRLENAYNDSKYVKARRDYGSKSAELKRLKAIKKKTEEEKETIIALKNDIEQCKAVMQAKTKKYHLNGTYPLSDALSVATNKYSKVLASTMVGTEKQKVESAMHSVLYGNGKQVHRVFLKDFKTIEANSRNGIIPLAVEGVERTKTYTALTTAVNDWQFGTSKFKTPVIFHVNMDFSDEYTFDSLYDCHIKRFGIKRRWFRNGWHYYLTMVIEGPAPKTIKDIERKRNNKVGVNYNIANIYAASNQTAMISYLAEGSDYYEYEIRKLQRENDRLLRNLNPDNYNENGTIKKGRLKWNRSRAIRKNYAKIRQLHRQRTDFIKNSHNCTANEIIREADAIVAEKAEFKKAQERRKETKRKDYEEPVKNNKGEVKMIRKFEKKKRFGNAILNHSPALMQTILKAKANQYDVPYTELDGKLYKAKEIDPLTGERTEQTDEVKKRETTEERRFRNLKEAYVVSCTEDGKELDTKKSKDGWQEFVKEWGKLKGK